MKRALVVMLTIIFFALGVSALASLNSNFSSHISGKSGNEKKFVIIITSYNNEKWYSYNLESALKQKYQNYRIIYINDASSDNTLPLVRDYIAQHDTNKKVTLINNLERKGACANFYEAINSCSPDEIVVILDGDDWLAHDNVLIMLNNTYQDSSVWMTYGQFKEYPSGNRGGSRPLPAWVIEHNVYREYPWVTSHLRSFYAFLFQQIKKEDFLHEDGFFPMAPDLAMMYPILEMGGKHSKFIPDVLYIYNRATSLNEDKINKDLQRHIDSVIRKKKKYQPLD